MRARPTAIRALMGGCALALCGCSDFPALEGTVPARLDRAAYPKLVPLEPLLAGLDDNQISDETEAGIAARVAALRTRAARLRGGVVDSSTRARMRAGVNQG